MHRTCCKIESNLRIHKCMSVHTVQCTVLCFAILHELCILTKLILFCFRHALDNAMYSICSHYSYLLYCIRSHYSCMFYCIYSHFMYVHCTVYAVTIHYFMYFIVYTVTIHVCFLYIQSQFMYVLFVYTFTCCLYFSFYSAGW